MRKKKERHKVKLVRWYDDGFPPINLSNELASVIELVRYTKDLELKLSEANKIIALYADKNQNQ